MSKEVKRYDHAGDHCGPQCGFEEAADGDWVRAADYDALLAERDALKKDAERYRFLMRELGGSVSQVVMGSPVFSNEDVDAAIDAALQGEQP